MKGLLVIVLIFSIGLTAFFPIGIILYPGFSPSDINNENVDFDYDIDFEYCSSSCEEPEYIEIEIINNKVYFVQVVYIYCNANDDIFWLECKKNLTTVSVIEIFEPNGSVARCVCPILITGVLRNLGNNTLTLAFIFENRYVDQTGIIQTFIINL